MSSLLYLLQQCRGFLLKRTFTNEVVVLVPSFELYQLALLLKFSVLFQSAWLLEICGLELFTAVDKQPTSHNKPAKLLSYRFKNASGLTVNILVLHLFLNTLSTIENLYLNARWLEREVAEMHDIFFIKKRDRRALFLVPLLYWAPLEASFPVSGFFEVRQNLEEGQIVALHTTWEE